MVVFSYELGKRSWSGLSATLEHVNPEDWAEQARANTGAKTYGIRF